MKNKKPVWLIEFLRTMMIPAFLSHVKPVMVLKLMSQEIIVQGVKEWQNRTPEIILPAKTKCQFSFIYHNLPL